MPREKISQGTIIRGLSSAKYPEVCCYAIIISARCDIANKKLSKYYYLTGVDLLQWLSTYHGFHKAYKDSIDAMKGKLFKKFSEDNVHLSVDELLSFIPKKASFSIVESYKQVTLSPKIKMEDRLAEVTADLEYLRQIYNPDVSLDQRTAFVQECNKSVKKGKTNPAVAFLKKITSGTENHFLFIPKCAYCETDEKNAGILVDLQEIYTLPNGDVELIENGPGIDYECLDFTAPETARLQEKYWLKGKDDFVEITGTIRSPWCEWLLQRFALDFIRVGVDTVTEHDFISMIDSI